MQTLEDAKKSVKTAITNASQELMAIGDHIWKNPEPGYREFKTSRFLIEKLEALGLKVKKNLAITGFRADIDTGRPGPTIAILGELDSLILPNHKECDPETGAVHACGHHVSATALVGTAVGLLHSGVLESLCGKIALIACPAEEGIELDYRKGLIAEGKIKSIAGKSQLIREGVFQDVDLSYMLHTSSRFAYYDHNGAINKKITFHGKSCHAASPQNGVNALNGANLALSAIALMRESYSNDPYVRIHGIITNGGDTVNIIPDTVTMEYMLRAPSLDSIVQLNERFDKVVLYAAKAAECEANIESVNGYMPLLDDPELGSVMEETVKELYPGKDFDANGKFLASCTDMGDVATILPGVHGYIPCISGNSHGITFRISDPETAFTGSALVNATMAVNLLYGDGKRAKKIAETKKNMLPVDEYIKIIDRINENVSSENL